MIIYNEKPTFIDISPQPTFIRIPNTDIPWCGDLHVVMNVSTVLKCEEACINDERCFQYVIERFSGIKEKSRCHLKDRSICSPKVAIEQIIYATIDHTVWSTISYQSL